MARTRTRTTRSGSEIVVVQANPPARRSGGGAIRRRRSSGGGKRRRRSRVGGGGGSIQSHLQNVALGGLAYGLIVKNVPQLPSIPGIGRSGTVALAIYFLKPSSKILRDVGVAAAAIAGYSFGSTGSVAGTSDDEDDLLANQ